MRLVRFLEVQDTNLDLVNLNDHPNLTVLRLWETYLYPLRLPPNLIELTIATVLDMPHLPNSLTKLCISGLTLPDLTNLPNLLELDLMLIDDRNFPKLPDTLLSLSFPKHTTPSTVTKLPSNLTRLDMQTCDVDCLQLAQPCTSVQELSFQMGNSTTRAARMPDFFPNVHTLQVDRIEDLPIFSSVKKLSLTIRKTLTLRNWVNLTDLSVTVKYNILTDPIHLDLPDSLQKLKIKHLGLNDFNVHFPPLLTFVSLRSQRPRFHVTMCENSTLRMLKIAGNVFKTKVCLPKSLKMFYVTVLKCHGLEENWEPLGQNVNFQVFDNPKLVLYCDGSLRQK